MSIGNVKLACVSEALLCKSFSTLNNQLSRLKYLQDDMQHIIAV